MLNSFRNLLSGRTLYLIVGVCALPFIFTGVSSFNTLFSNYGTVNGIEVTQLDVNNATIRVEERYKSIFGENFSIDQLQEQELLNLIKSQITNQKIIEAMAFNNNLDISMDDVKRAIIKEETFLDENGIFDQSIFEAAVRGAGMIPDEYLQFVLTSITADNLIGAISQSTFVLNEDLIDFTAFAEATKDIKFIKSDRDEIISLQSSSDQEAKEFYDSSPKSEFGKPVLLLRLFQKHRERCLKEGIVHVFVQFTPWNFYDPNENKSPKQFYEVLKKVHETCPGFYTFGVTIVKQFGKRRDARFQTSGLAQDFCNRTSPSS